MLYNNIHFTRYTRSVGFRASKFVINAQKSAVYS